MERQPRGRCAKSAFPTLLSISPLRRRPISGHPGYRVKIQGNSFQGGRERASFLMTLLGFKKDFGNFLFCHCVYWFAVVIYSPIYKPSSECRRRPVEETNGKSINNTLDWDFNSRSFIIWCCLSSTIKRKWFHAPV